jgi:hypothetical protein
MSLSLDYDDEVKVPLGELNSTGHQRACHDGVLTATEMEKLVQMFFMVIWFPKCHNKRECDRHGFNCNQPTFKNGTFESLRTQFLHYILTKEILDERDKATLSRFVRSSTNINLIGLFCCGTDFISCEFCKTLLSKANCYCEFVSHWEQFFVENDPYDTLRISTYDELLNKCIKLVLEMGGIIFGSAVVYLVNETHVPNDLDIAIDADKIIQLVRFFTQFFYVSVLRTNGKYGSYGTAHKSYKFMTINGIVLHIDLVSLEEYRKIGADLIGFAGECSSDELPQSEQHGHITHGSEPTNFRLRNCKGKSFVYVQKQMIRSETEFNDPFPKSDFSHILNIMTYGMLFSLLKAVVRARQKRLNGWTILGGLPDYASFLINHRCRTDDFSSMLSTYMYGKNRDMNCVTGIISSYIGTFSDSENTSTTLLRRCRCENLEDGDGYLFRCPTCASLQCITCAIKAYINIAQRNREVPINRFVCLRGKRCKKH